MSNENKFLNRLTNVNPFFFHPEIYQIVRVPILRHSLLFTYPSENLCCLQDFHILRVNKQKAVA